MSTKIIQEYAPGQFRPFDRGQASKTFTKANQITRYADGRREEVEIDVAPYKAPITVSSVRGWTDEELASCDLHRVTAFEFPADKAPAGDPVFSRDGNGVVVETIPLKDVPPPPSTEEKITQVLVHVGLSREELRQLLAAGAGGR